MNSENLFLCSSAAPVPARWREAFPVGQVFEAPGLLACLRGQPTTQCLVWLSSADAQWRLYLRQILQVRPGTAVVLLSGTPDAQEGLYALNQGAHGYTHSHAVPALLQEVALVIEHGGLWVGPDLLQRLIGSTSAALARRPAPVETAAASVSALNPWELLSTREMEVARAVLEGRSNKEVAALLYICERTVKAHLGAVFEKLGVRDRLQLALCLSARADFGVSPEVMVDKKPANMYQSPIGRQMAHH